MQNVILFGPMGAGKGEVAKILVERHEYTVGSLGGKIHTETRLHGSESREEMQEYGQAMRRIFGENVWNDWVAKQFHTGCFGTDLTGGRFVIDDGRQLNEFDYWKKKGFIAIGITAEPIIRAYRLKLRNGKPTPPERFKHETELQAIECFKKCDYQIINNGELDELKQRVEEIINEIK